MIFERPFRVVELYAGTARSIEPFRRWRRCAVSALIDHNELAAATYRKNFADAPYHVLDLDGLGGQALQRLAGGRIDILLGCPPCQGFSETGLRDPLDPRNAHLANFARLATELKPLAIGMENVPLAAGARRFGNFVKTLERAGYVWTAGILNGALRGSAQCRHRLALIAIRKDVEAVPEIPISSYGGSSRRYYCYASDTFRTIASDRITMLGEAPAARRVRDRLPFTEASLGCNDIPTVGEVLEGLPRLGTDEAKRLQHFQWAHKKAVLRRMERVPEGGRWRGGEDHYSHTYGRLHRRGLARTVTTFFPNSGGGRFWHPTENRSLTLREAARLQGFPDTFQFLPHYSRAAVLVGNALDSAVSETIYDVIRSCLS